MMKFRRNTKGAVSIFLIIILLPCITIAGLFLDVSRVVMSEEVVTTSADLALNTTLSAYDKNLKDYFGLLASCQDTTEVIDLSKQYFAESMVSAGIPTSAAGEYVDEVLSVFTGDKDIRDMLQISVDGDVSITGTENGALDNPALLKAEIIEFMKYRAPVNGIEALFNKITDSGVAEQLENASKETEMIEKKKDFYEAEEKLIEQAEVAYNAIKKYEKSADFDLEEFKKFMASPDGTGSNFESIYRAAHERMVMNLYNTHKTDGTLSVSLISKKSISTPSSVNTYSDSSKASASEIKTLLISFNTKLLNYISAKSSLDTAWNNVGAMTSSDYPIQYWVVLTDACSTSYSDYAVKANELWKAVLKLENAVSYAKDDAMDELMKLSDVTNNNVTYDIADSDGKLSLESIYRTLISKYNNTYKTEITGGGAACFKNISNQINSLDTSANQDLLKLTTVSHIYNIRNKVNSYKSGFNDAYELAETAKKETNKLKSLLKKYKEAFDAWKKAAKDPELDDSDLADSDRKEIEELEKTGIELFSENSVTQLADRLENIQKLCKTFRDDLKAIKYKNTAVIDVSNYAKFRNSADLDASKIVRYKSQLQQYASESFSFSIGTQIQNIRISANTTSTTLSNGDTYTITDSFHPDLQRTKLELYEWMKQKFDAPTSGTSVTAAETGFDVDDKSSAKDAKSAVSDKAEDTSEVDTSGNDLSGECKHDFSEWNGAVLPSKEEGAPVDLSVTTKLKEVGDFASSIFSDFSGTFMNSLVNIRDDLYMIDYTFSMFTYDTFNNEGYYSQLDPDVQKSLKAGEAESRYTTTVKQAWTSSDEYKTLTLTPRDSSANWAYCGEIEYILYGNASDAANKTTAYAQIYLIRYALDLPIVFKVYWNDELLNTLANALEVLAFIPAPLTKVLACLAITAAEAGIDIYTLKQGIPVALIKTEDDLVCSYKTVFMNQTKESKNTAKIKLQYSDYLKVFLFINLVRKNEKEIYARTADVIQANMSHVTGDFTYALSKAQVYYDLNAAVTIEPMWSRLLAIDNLGDVSTEKSWRTITIDMKRGY